MDDGFFSRHSTFDLNILKNILNNLHPTKKNYGGAGKI